MGKCADKPLSNTQVTIHGKIILIARGCLRRRYIYIYINHFLFRDIMRYYFSWRSRIHHYLEFSSRFDKL